jgi:hypothetical protein
MDGLPKKPEEDLLSWADSLKKTAPKSAPKSGDDSVASVLDDEFLKLGYPSTARLSILGDVGRENAWNRDTIFGGHNDPKNNARTEELSRGRASAGPNSTVI